MRFPKYIKLNWLAWMFPRLVQLRLPCVALLMASVNVQAQPPQLVPVDKKFEIVHDGTSAPQHFLPQRWNIVVPNSYRGATVYWTCGPFQHVSHPKFQADAQLMVRVDRSQGEARWTAVKAVDTTSLAGNDLEAMVIAASGRRGHAQVELLVSFIESSQSLLAAGDYEVKVMATITEN